MQKSDVVVKKRGMGRGNVYPSDGSIFSKLGDRDAEKIQHFRGKGAILLLRVVSDFSILENKRVCPHIGKCQKFRAILSLVISLKKEYGTAY